MNELSPKMLEAFEDELIKIAIARDLEKQALFGLVFRGGSKAATQGAGELAKGVARVTPKKTVISPAARRLMGRFQVKTPSNLESVYRTTTTTRGPLPMRAVL